MDGSSLQASVFSFFRPVLPQPNLLIRPPHSCEETPASLAGESLGKMLRWYFLYHYRARCTTIPRI